MIGEQRTLLSLQDLPLSLPTRKNPIWRYADLSWLKACHVNGKDAPAQTNKFNALAIVDGMVVKHTIPMMAQSYGIEVYGVGKAQEDGLLNTPYADLFASKYHGLHTLQTQYHQDGIYAILPANRNHEDQPLILDVSNASDHGNLCINHHVFVLKPGSRAILIERRDNKYHAKHSISKHFDVQSQAYLQHIIIDAPRSEDFIMHHDEYHISQDGHVETFVLTQGRGFCRHHIDVFLSGPRAKAAIRGLGIGYDSAHIDIHIDAHHLADDTQSIQSVRHIAQDNATCVYHGHALIPKHQKRCLAHQHNHNMSLSSKAKLMSRPELTILSGDVDCQHGSTTGSLDEQAVHYCQSRGIPLCMARQMLIEGFAKAVIHEHSDPTITQLLIDTLSKEALAIISGARI